MSIGLESTRTDASARADLDALVGIRFPFAVWVVLYHCGYLTLTTGVTFFFVLSGFILTYVYARGDRLRVDFGTFMVARLSRMYPVYAWGLVLTVAWRLWDGPPVGDGLGALFASATLVQAWSPDLVHGWNTPGWTCSDDLFFYLLFPLLIGLTARIRGTAALLAWIVGWWLVGQAISTAAWLHLRNSTAAIDPWLVVLKFNPISNLPDFAIGLAAGRLYAASGRLSDPARGTWISALSLTAAVWTTLQAPLPYEFVHSTLLAPVYALLVWGLALGGGIARPLSHPVLMETGRWSFALYILQEPIGIPLFQVLGEPGWENHDPTTVIGFLALLVAASAATCHGLEKPSKRWLRGLWKAGAPTCVRARPSLAGLALIVVLVGIAHDLPQTRTSLVPKAAHRVPQSGRMVVPLALGQTFGVEPLPQVGLRGFHGIERDDRGPYRWTSGRAELVIARLAEPPGLLTVELGPGQATALEVRVDDRVVWKGKVPHGRPLSLVIPLKPRGEEETRIALTCVPFVPRHLDPRSPDERSLGVRLRGLQFLR